MHPWIRKYQPEKSSDIIGQDDALKSIREYIQDYKKQKKRSLFIYGMIGTGKTSSVHVIANEFDLELIEINASDFRNQKMIEQKIGNALREGSLFGKQKLILVDEIDGLSGQKDRGGASTLAKLIDKAKFPVILTANDPFNKKLKEVKKRSELIEFKPLGYLDIFNLLKKICKKEKVTYDDETTLKILARHVGGDARAAINDLQTLSGRTGKISKKDIETLSYREKKESIETALTLVFKTTNPNLSISALDRVEANLDEWFLWLDENLPHEYTNPHDLAEAYDKISKADVFKGRIRKRQDWRFLVYINALLTSGISVSKEKKYSHMVSYKQTMRPLKIWQAKMKYLLRTSIAEKIAEKTHTSKKRALHDILPYIQLIFKQGKKKSDPIADSLELNNEEISWLKK